jgi:hypothetical protein
MGGSDTTVAPLQEPTRSPRTRLSKFDQSTLRGLFGLGLSPVHQLRYPTLRGKTARHNLAKVGVEGSNPFARSKFGSEYRGLRKSGAASGYRAAPRGSRGEAGPAIWTYPKRRIRLTGNPGAKGLGPAFARRDATTVFRPRKFSDNPNKTAPVTFLRPA